MKRYYILLYGETCSLGDKLNGLWPRKQAGQKDYAASLART